MRAAFVSVLVLLVPLVPAVPAIDVGAAAQFTVAASNFEWTPDDLTIAPGDSVEFVNEGGSHTWELADGSDPCELPCLKTFPVEATIEYRCGIHTSMLGTVNVGLPPVLTISSPTPGSTVSGTALVTGSASHSSAAITNVTVRIGNEPAVVAQLSGGGSSVTWSASVPTTSVLNGASTITAIVTAANGLSATTSIAVVVDNPDVIDLALIALSAQQGAITSNLISFGVANDGNTASGAFVVLVEYLYHGTWRAIGEVSLASIEPGGQTQSTILWTPGVPNVHVGAFTIRARADPEGTLPDPNLANNIRTATAAWLTNGVPGIILTEP